MIEPKVKNEELAKLKKDLESLRKPELTEEDLLIERAEAEYFTDIFESAEKDK